MHRCNNGLKLQRDATPPAAILLYLENKTTGVLELLKRSFDCRRIGAKAWYFPTVLLMPGIMVLSYGVMRFLQLPLPTPQFPLLAALAMFLVFFIAALGEEIGLMGYAIDPMQDRWNAIQASILLGWYGPRGTSYCLCRPTDLQHGSPGSVSPWWRHGSFWSGSTTTPARAYVPWRCVTPRRMLVGNYFRTRVHIMIRV